MCKSNKTYTEFNLTGTIKNVWMKEDKPKFMTLQTPLGLLLIKLSKAARMIEISNLVPGQEVRVTGQKKQDFKTGKIKLKAEQVLPIGQIFPSVIPVEPVQQSGVKPAKILICQKSDCRKRGGDAICTVLQQELAQRGLEDQVTIQKTGCLKKCKAGPNLVILPDKTRYSKVEPQKIPALIEQHF